MDSNANISTSTSLIFFSCCTTISIYWGTNCLSSKACQLQKVLETADWKVQAKDPTIGMQGSWVFYICPKGLFLEGLPWWFSGKEPTCQCKRHKRCGFAPWSGRSPGGGLDNSLHYSCLENPMDRGTWPTSVHRVAKSWTRLKWLSIHEVMILVPG